MFHRKLSTQVNGLIIGSCLALLTLGCVSQQVSKTVTTGENEATRAAFQPQASSQTMPRIPTTEVCVASARRKQETSQPHAQTQLRAAEPIVLGDTEPIVLGDTEPIALGDAEPQKVVQSFPTLSLPTRQQHAAAVVEANPLSLTTSTALEVESPPAADVTEVAEEREAATQSFLVNATPLTFPEPVEELYSGFEELPNDAPSYVGDSSRHVASSDSRMLKADLESAADSFFHSPSRANQIVYRAPDLQWQEPFSMAPAKLQQDRQLLSGPNSERNRPDRLLATATSDIASASKLPTATRDHSPRREFRRAFPQETPAQAAKQLVATQAQPTAGPGADMQLPRDHGERMRVHQSGKSLLAANTMVHQRSDAAEAGDLASHKGGIANPREKRLQDRLERLNLGFPIEGRVRVVLNNRVAILHGEVSAQSDGRTIERLLRMEPGVDEVRNELEIATADQADVRTAATW